MKLQELERVNSHLRNALMSKESENEEYKNIIKDLNLNLINSNSMIKQTKEYYNDMLQEKRQ